ncbi:hypothetical protein ACFZB6_26575 [Streptomyces syringium]|uniref:hypothetical protein n=1 Tax=Streptomyces syringium TaxID=76729 RepID=UPI0036EBC33D
MRAAMAVPGYHEEALQRIELSVRLHHAHEFMMTPAGQDHLLRAIFGAEAEQMIRGRK